MAGIRRVAALVAAAAVVTLGAGCEALERARLADAELVAADGDDLDACRGGACEVLVGESARIQVDGAGVASLEIESIEDGSVVLWLENAPGDGPRVTCDHRSCAIAVMATSITEPATVRSSIGEGALLTVNDLTVEARSVADGEAVLRLAHADH